MMKTSKRFRGLCEPGSTFATPWTGVDKTTHESPHLSCQISTSATPRDDSHVLVQVIKTSRLRHAKIGKRTHDSLIRKNITFLPRQFTKRPHWSQHWASSYWLGLCSRSKIRKWLMKLKLTYF